MKIESVLHNDKHLLAQEQTKRFTGQKQDGTGLLYYNARYYDPALGTFLSPDTLVSAQRDKRRIGSGPLSLT